MSIMLENVSGNFFIWCISILTDFKSLFLVPIEDAIPRMERMIRLFVLVHQPYLASKQLTLHAATFAGNLCALSASVS